MLSLQAVSKKRINKKSTFFKRKTTALLLLALPGILFLLVFNYLPIGGLLLAFKDFRYDKGFFGSDWVGFKNFSFFFTSQDAWRVTRNTIGYNLVFIVTVIAVSVLLAILLNEVKNRSAVKFYQTVMFFPYFLSFSVVSVIGYALLNFDYGVLNQIARSLGTNEVAWYSEANYWMIIIPVVNLWKSIGYNIVIFYAGLMAIDSSYYEAAAIDGATKLQMITKITIPLLSPLIVMLTLIMIGKIFYSDFGLFYMVPNNSGSLFRTTDVIDTYVYRSLKEVGDIGMATAVGLYQSVVGLGIVVFSNWLVRKYNEENALF